MAKPSQAENPWVSKVHFQCALDRAVEAETCLRRLLDYIDPDVLTRHDFDWKAAVDELTA